MMLVSVGGGFVFDRYSRVAALFLWLVPVAIAQGQDSVRLARALGRAEKFDLGLVVSH